MRRYISIFSVLLVAMFAATSCQLDSGTEIKPNRANQLLWNRVNEALVGQHECIQTVAWLHDYMLDAKWSAIYEPTDVSEEDGVYTLTNILPDNYRTTTYRIDTNGKKLSEGGEWVVYVKYGSYMEFAKVGVAKGVVGENAKFSLDCEVSHQTPYYSTLQSEVEYLFNTTEDIYEVTLSKCKGASTDYGGATNYLIEFEATEPLIYRKVELYSGEVRILYTDYIANTSRTLTVEIANKIITFAPKE